MTVQDIISTLFSGKPLIYVTPSRKAVPVNRVTLAKGQAARSHVEWSDVLAAMTDEQRKQVDAVTE